MTMSTYQTEDVRKLIELCRALAKLGLDVGMSDARPALSVRRVCADPRLWISVSVAGDFFEWCRSGDERHAVSDPAGAAQSIADRLHRPICRDRHKML